MRKWSNLTNIFQTGWNHQLDNDDHKIFLELKWPLYMENKHRFGRFQPQNRGETASRYVTAHTKSPVKWVFQAL